MIDFDIYDRYTDILSAYYNNLVVEEDVLMKIFKLISVIGFLGYGISGFAANFDLNKEIVFSDHSQLVTEFGQGTYKHGRLNKVNCLEEFCLVFGTQNITNNQGQSETSSILLQTDNSGSTWQIISPLRNAPQGAIFSDGSCSDTVCVLIGKYFINDVSLPLVARSPDRGVTWQVITRFKDLPLHASFNDVSCTSIVCVLVGSGIEENAHPKPLILNSIDKGLSWNVVNSISLLPPHQHESQPLVSVSCSGIFCVASGTRYDHILKKNIPLIVQSFNSGGQWRDMAQYISNMPSSGQLSSTSCSGELCVVGGLSGQTGSTYAPIILQTQNGGNSWKIVPISGLPSKGVIHDVNCFDNTCIAGGSDRTSLKAPLLAQSINYGTSWALIRSIPNTPINGEFESVNCSDWFCSAVGSYHQTDNVNLVPMLADKTYERNFWAFSSVIEPPIRGNLTDTACTNNLCVAVGSILTQNVPSSPLLIQSIDGGNWNIINIE